MRKLATHPDWPVLKTYDQDHLARIGGPQDQQVRHRPAGRQLGHRLVRGAILTEAN